jgi:hypothetical protein
VRLVRLSKLKKFIRLIVSRTVDLQALSIVPQPLRCRVSLHPLIHYINLDQNIVVLHETSRPQHSGTEAKQAVGVFIHSCPLNHH